MKEGSSVAPNSIVASHAQATSYAQRRGAIVPDSTAKERVIGGRAIQIGDRLADRLTPL